MIGAGRRRAPVIPTGAPWNAPRHLITPTPDGTGSTVHPSVHDFGSGRKWRGWRYWMAHTPFHLSNDDLENPCILVSNDGYQWVEPAGISNPIYPWPEGRRFNSDPDLEYDPRSDELVLIYREMQMDGSHETFLARSPDGVTWPAKAARLNWVRPSGDIDYTQMLSPCIIRKAEGEWVLYSIQKGPSTLRRWTATSPEGPWGESVACTGLPGGSWHIDVAWDGSRFLAIVDMVAGASDGLRLGVSTNGTTWTFNPANTLGKVYPWESTQTYRPTFTKHEAGDRFRVWYSASGAYSWRIGYTELPTSLWPA